MNKYQALENVWSGQTVYAEDDMGTMYKFKRKGDQFNYTRKEIDEWFNDITVTQFLTQYYNFNG